MKKMSICCYVFIFSWLLCFSGLAQKQNDKVRIEFHPIVSSDARIKTMLVSEDGNLWIATSSGLIYGDQNGNVKNIYQPDIEVIDIVSDNKNQMWAASNSTIININNEQSYQLDQHTTAINDITYYQGHIWIASNNGLFQLNTTTGKFKIYDTKNSKLASNLINFVHADKNRILWVGTSKGYLRINGDNWEIQDKNLQMIATCENNEGQWIITNEDMFLINKYNRLFPVNLDKKQYKGKINNFTIDAKGKIYIASDILSCYDPYTETVENYSDDASILSKAALSLSCDKNNNVWVGTDGAGLYKLSFGEAEATNLYASCIIQTSIKCNGQNTGSIKVSITGGSPPYSVLWQNGATTEQLKDLPSGYYAVTVSDNNGNTAYAGGKISDPKSLSILNIENIKVNNPSVPDGRLSVNALGGTSPFKYLWSNNLTTPTIKDLPVGMYSVTVTDKNGCTASGEFHVKREKYIPELEISMVTLGQKLRINELNFQADSSKITSENYDILDEVFEFLNTNKSVIVEIGGHTNTIPPHEYCDKLSAARANNVAQYLIRRGIEPSRVDHKGYGKREPLTDSESLQGRQRNQRVEIKILQL